MSAAEQRKRNDAISELLQELRAARETMENRAPGKPCVELPLDAVFTFTGRDGEVSAVITVEQVIYLADAVLRMNR